MEYYDIIDQAASKAEYEIIRPIHWSTTKYERGQTYLQRTICATSNEHDILFSNEGKLVLCRSYYVRLKNERCSMPFST